MQQEQQAKPKADPRVLTTGECRLSFPALWKPKSVPGSDGEPKFGCTLLLPPSTDLAPFLAALKAAVLMEWGEIVAMSPSKNPIKDCATYPYPSGRYHGYDDGWHFIRTSSKLQPGVFSRSLRPLTKDQAGEYPGMWVKARLNAYAWTHKLSGKGVSFGLQALQLIKDGEPLDGRIVDPNVAFEALAEDELPTATGTRPVGSDADAESLFG